MNGRRSRGRRPKATVFHHGPKYAGVYPAGLWEHWTNSPKGTRIDTCTIITTDANELMQKVHTRMPVILDPADYPRWLFDRMTCRIPRHVLPLPGQLPAEKMQLTSCQRIAGDLPRNDRASVRSRLATLRASEPPDSSRRVIGAQTSLVGISRSNVPASGECYIFSTRTVPGGAETS